MKNLDLNALDVQKMNAEEIILHNGGSMTGPSASYYMTSDQMNTAGNPEMDLIVILVQPHV